MQANQNVFLTFSDFNLCFMALITIYLSVA